MLDIRSSASAKLTVAGGDLATVLNQTPEDGFPGVLATARLTGPMKLAASRAMRAALGPGESSVGVALEVVHGAATPIGAAVSAVARFTGMEGKLFLFEVGASDGGGEICRGRHKRAIVAAERLLQGARRRNPE